MSMGCSLCLQMEVVSLRSTISLASEQGLPRPFQTATLSLIQIVEFSETDEVFNPFSLAFGEGMIVYI